MAAANKASVRSGFEAPLPSRIVLAALARAQLGDGPALDLVRLHPGLEVDHVAPAGPLLDGRLRLHGRVACIRDPENA